MNGIKVADAMEKIDLPVDSIRVYIPELMKEIDSSVERGEIPRIRVKKDFRISTKRNEITLIFLGKQNERHVEELTYFSKQPKDWSSWGTIIMSVEQARNLKEALNEIV